MKQFLTYISLIGLLFLSACHDNRSMDPATQKTYKSASSFPSNTPPWMKSRAALKTLLSAELKQKVSFQVMRAQGDMNLQRSMILQLQNQKVDLFAPISTQTTEMTASMVHDRPIVGVAALLPDSVRAKSPLALVDDEITPTQIIQFIHAIYPKKTQLSLVYSNNDKMIPQVDEAVSAGAALGIQVEKRMITTLPDLYSVAQSLSPQTEGILVLKDVQVASGIATLVKVADEKHLPLITSDDGTVENGAGFALGVKEYQIGVEGAKVAAKILQGTPPQNIPVVRMTNLSVFINPTALKAQDQDTAAIEKEAATRHYKIINVTNKKAVQ